MKNETDAIPKQIYNRLEKHNGSAARQPPTLLRPGCCTPKLVIPINRPRRASGITLANQVLPGNATVPAPKQCQTDSSRKNKRANDGDEKAKKAEGTSRNIGILSRKKPRFNRHYFSLPEAVRPNWM